MSTAGAASRACGPVTETAAWSPFLSIAGGSDDAGVGGGVDVSGDLGVVADGGDDHDVVGDGPVDGFAELGVVRSDEGEAEHGGAVVDGPVDGGFGSGAESQSVECVAGGDDCGFGCDAGGVAVGGDESGHGGAVSVRVGLGVGRRICGVVDAGGDGAGEVGVSGVDAGVDDADGDSLALAVLVGLGDVEISQMPLVLPGGYGRRG